MNRRTALVVAPGRGTYNKDELGYLTRHHGARTQLFSAFDAIRREAGQEPIQSLDSSDVFSVAKFSRGDNASGLIYACAYADFLTIDQNKFEVVAVTGNSMGWYSALACSGAASAPDGFRIVNTMGTLMQEALIGGQMLYPFVDDDWIAIPGKREELLDLIEAIPGLHLSIDLGGMIVFGGSADALAEAQKRLPKTGGRFPMTLHNHAAFHTPLQVPVSRRGKEALRQALFKQPAIPLVDGRGSIWFPHSTELQALRDYTLGEQVVAPYDFSSAIRVAIREFAPDVVIVLGPGTTLGGAVAQALIMDKWRGIASKGDFQERQRQNPVLLSMGIEAQRSATSRSIV